MLIIGFVISTVIMFASYVEAVTIVKNIDSKTPQYIDNLGDMYDNDLSRIERYLFRKTYEYNNLQSRLNRIERHLFDRIFSDWNNTRRINHILANYKEDFERNYLSNYNSRRPVQRVRKRIVGQPTGFTPSIMDMPFGSGFFNNGFGNYVTPGYSQGFASNRGYGFINSLPAMTRTGITILD